MSELNLQDLPLWGDERAQAILEGVCEKHGIPVDTLTALVQVQRERQHQERAHGIYDRFDEIFMVVD